MEELRNYDIILSKFGCYIDAMKTRSPERLKDIFIPEAKVYLSTVRDFQDSSQHGLNGISNYIVDQPETDAYYARICNPVVRIKDDRAQMTALVVCHTYRGNNEDFRYFDFTQLYSVRWALLGEEWRISELRMDLTNHTGTDSAFCEGWFFQDLQTEWTPNMHLPCVNGELDNPWHIIAEDETILSEEEQILETMYAYAFGVDCGCFDNLEKTLSPDVIIDMQPWGIMNRRVFMTTLKYIRATVFYSGHPVVPYNIQSDGKNAVVRLWRLSGQVHKYYPVDYSYEERDHEYSSASYIVKLKKENGKWSIVNLTYLWGLTDLGTFQKTT